MHIGDGLAEHTVDAMTKRLTDLADASEREADMVINMSKTVSQISGIYFVQTVLINYVTGCYKLFTSNNSIVTLSIQYN